MKFNFWQILGIILVIGGLIGMLWWHGYLGTTPATAPAP
jgi:cytoskeletal protein RodZ